MAVCLIDFDGTCVYQAPTGEYCVEDTGAARVLRKLVKNGHKLVLWTCRNHSEDNPYNYTKDGIYRDIDSLQEAINWFRNRRIPLFGINEAPGEVEIIGTTKKPLADIIIDNTSLGMPIMKNSVECINYDTGKITVRYVSCVDWKKVAKLLKHEGLI